MAVIGGLVRRTGRVCPDQDLDLLDLLGGICARARSITVLWSAAVFEPAFPGRNSIANASRVSSAYAPSGWNPYPCL